MNDDRPDPELLRSVFEGTEVLRKPLSGIISGHHVLPLEVDFTVNQERLRAFLADMEHWMREGDVVRRKTLLREVYKEIRIWPKTATKPWTRKLFVAANLDALTRFWMVSPTGLGQRGRRSFAVRWPPNAKQAAVRRSISA